MKYCAKCGATNLDAATHCISCNNELGVPKRSAKGTIMMGSSLSQPSTPASAPPPNPAGSNKTPSGAPTGKMAYQSTLMGPLSGSTTGKIASSPPNKASVSSRPLAGSPSLSGTSSYSKASSKPPAFPLKSSASSPASASFAKQSSSAAKPYTSSASSQVPVSASIPPSSSYSTPYASAPYSAPSRSAYTSDPVNPTSPTLISERPGASDRPKSAKQVSVEMAANLLPHRPNRSVEEWLLYAMQQPWFGRAVIATIVILIVCPLVAMGMSVYLLSRQSHVDSALRAEQLRISSTITLGAIKRECQRENTGNLALSFVHPSSKAKFQGVLCGMLDDETIRLFGSPEQSYARLVEDTTDEDRVEDLNIDPEACVQISGQTSKLIGCQTERQGFVIIDLVKN